MEEKDKNVLEMPLGNTFNPPKRKYIGAIYNQWAGKRDQAIADLTIYLENPVGVGEHSNIGEEIKNKIREVDKYDSLVQTIENHFFANGERSEGPSEEKP